MEKKSSVWNIYGRLLLVGGMLALLLVAGIGAHAFSYNNYLARSPTRLEIKKPNTKQSDELRTGVFRIPVPKAATVSTHPTLGITIESPTMTANQSRLTHLSSSSNGDVQLLHQAILNTLNFTVIVAPIGPSHIQKDEHIQAPPLESLQLPKPVSFLVVPEESTQSMAKVESRSLHSSDAKSESKKQSTLMYSRILTPKYKRGPLYRIADGLVFYPGAPGCKHYPKSIVCAYRKRTHQNNSIPHLLAVLDARVPRQIPDPDIAVMHLRLSDGLCAQEDRRCNRTSQAEPDCWNVATDCVARGYPLSWRYTYPKQYYEVVASQLNPGQRVVIMGNVAHWAVHGVERNETYVDEKYISQAVAFFRSLHFKVQVRKTGTTDDDFMYACAARTFVVGGGGFSSLIAEVVRARGGIVLPSIVDRNITHDLRWHQH